MFYKLSTTIDITNTGQYRNEPGREQARLQQQNFDTLVNTIGMRSNIIYDYSPKVIIDYPKNVGLTGKNLSNIWVFEWRVEYAYVFKEQEDDVAFLKKDFALVPYNANLTETTTYKTNVFMPGVNINFEMLR